MNRNKIIFLLSFLLLFTYSNIIPSDYIISKYMKISKKIKKILKSNILDFKTYLIIEY